MMDGKIRDTIQLLYVVRSEHADFLSDEGKKAIEQTILDLFKKADIENPNPERMIEELGYPVCDTAYGIWDWIDSVGCGYTY